MTVAFRADASQHIGLGHLRRCLALAHALKAFGTDVVFVSRDLGVDSGTMIEAEGFRSIMLPAPADDAPVGIAAPHAAGAGVSQESDAAQVASALRALGPQWVVVDSYAFGEPWHTAVRDELGCRIAAIEDLADRPLAPNLLVDHNLVDDHRHKYGACLRPGTPLLGGPRFALLGPAFAQAPRYSFCTTVRSVGIFMGGVDRDNHSATVLEALDAAGFTGPVEIVTTRANPNLATLSHAVARRPQTTLSVDLPDLAAFFVRHDLQVGAGGGATWERCCVGVPTLLLIIADNQRATGSELARRGVVALAPAADRDTVAAELAPLLADSARRRVLAEKSRELVDGLGARRVALCMMADTLTTRPATLDDSLTMLEWRNHPATRSVSRQSGEISLEQHSGWLQAVLSDPARVVLIGAIGNIPIGVIRFDRCGDSAEVSLYLDPDLHGLGLGRALLAAGEATVASGLDIKAEVLEGNVGSARLFESAGYRSVAANHWIKPATRKP